MSNAHATKRGPGRHHKGGTYRNGKRHGKPAKMGFADAIQNAAAVKRAGDKARKLLHPLRDKHGALTLTGATCEFVDYCQTDSRWYELSGSSGPESFATIERRIWLAGISAQRGY